MTAPFDAEALFQKAVLFSNRRRAAVTFDEQALWAAFGLELLAKAALSKVNPCLIADPMDDGKSLLIAAGISKDYSGFKSVQAKTAFSRCARAFPPFNRDEADLISKNRNEDVHSAALPFASLRSETWWPRYWAQMVLLLHAQDRSLADLVGESEAADVEELLAANRGNVAHRVQALIQRAEQRLELVSSGSVPIRVAAELAAANRSASHYEYSISHECPACSGQASLLGSFETDSEVEYDGDGDALELVTVQTDAFTCSNCGLLFERLDFLEAAGLPAEFEVEREHEFEGEEYGND